MESTEGMLAMLCGVLNGGKNEGGKKGRGGRKEGIVGRVSNTVRSCIEEKRRNAAATVCLKCLLTPVLQATTRRRERTAVMKNTRQDAVCDEEGLPMIAEESWRLVGGAGG
jgi:hypothetical protein